MKKIALLECVDDNPIYSKISKLTSHSKIRYCNSHRYDFVYFKFTDLGRPPYWSRVAGISKYLKDYDWVFNIDSDMLISNQNIKLETYIDDDYDILVGMMPDSKTGLPIHISTGMLFVKNSKWSHWFLNQWWEQTHFNDHPYFPKPWSNNGAVIGNRGGLFFDQSAFHYLYDTNQECRKHIKIMPNSWCNKRESSYVIGDFLIHFAGDNKSKEMRIRTFGSKYTSLL